MKAPELDAPSLADIRAARRRIAGLALRTPLVRLDAGGGPAEILLKLESLQPIGSFKVRGAGNAILALPLQELAAGVYTASAGNMAQGVAYAARRRSIPCAAVVPDHAPQAKLSAIERLGGNIVKVPFDQWWQVFRTHRFEGLPGRFIHPVSDTAVMAGNGTIGLEILEDAPEVDAFVIPFGGGGLSCGIAAAVRALRPQSRILAVEVETAAPLTASLAAGAPREIDYRRSFVDGIGGKSVLPEMWPLIRGLIDDVIVVTLAEVAGAIRVHAGRSRVIAEGAGAAAAAAALAGKAGRGTVACIVSGGNIDEGALAAILRGKMP